MLDQALAQRIFSHVRPPLVVLFSVAEPMMKAAALKLPGLVEMATAELPFPKLDPRVDAESEIARRAEQVQVIGHEQVVADEPGRGFLAPDRDERVLHFRLVHPRHWVHDAKVTKS